jgi:hypothetical protein
MSRCPAWQRSPWAQLPSSVVRCSALRWGNSGVPTCEGIKQDLELLEQMPEMEAARREVLQRSINDRIDELIVAEDKARQLRATASSYEGNWRDIVLFLCTVLFSIVWWSVDHDRDSWLPVFITTIVASVVAGGYAVRGLRRSVRRVRRRADRDQQS